MSGSGILRVCRAALRADTRGQTMVLAATAITVFLGFCALGVDVGLLWTQQRQMQNAADSAALAAVRELDDGYTSSITSAAQNDAKLNGFNYQTAGVSVTVNNPPLSGVYAGSSSAVEVIISQAEPTYFLSVLGTSSVTVSARAVGHLGSGSGCLFALSTSASNAVQVVAGSSITAPLCAIVSNSSASSALDSVAGSTMTASSIGAVGGYQGSGYSPTPTTGISAVSDPLAYVAAPTVGSCNHTNFSVSAGATATLSQGVYCGGITISAGSTATFNAGTYILYGGGLTISAGSSASGTGVTFYDTAGGSYSFQPITISAGSTASFSAPTSGSFEGILFFQDRTISGSYTNNIEAGSGGTFNGALYFPTTALDYAAGSESAQYTILVASTISVVAGSSVYLNANYSANVDGSPVRAPMLGE